MNCRHLALVACAVGALVTVATTAEARRGKAPASRSVSVSSAETIETYFIPPIDLEALRSEDEARGKLGEPFRYAEPIGVSITPWTHGTTETLADGGQLWRLRFDAPGATDLNLGFATYRLPAGAALWVSSDVMDYYEGPYTHLDNEDHGELWLPVVPGSRATLELYVPAEVKHDPELLLTHVGWGYQDLFKMHEGPVLLQGSCNNDVICPEGDPWRDQIASVGAYSTGGSIFCTGQMVNNERGDFRNYFLTAAHCGISSGNAPSLVVYWNFESPSCGLLSGGSLADNQTGAVWRAGRGDVDFSLVELDDDPDPAHGVFYTGWDATGTVPGGSVAIHHPSGDEKAISFNTDALTTIASCIGGGTPSTHWRVNNWEDGTTEPGSSGSGLWHPTSQRLIGFLSGGLASCSVIDYDCYGKTAVAWNGSAATSRLKDWLDPDGTGTLEIDGLAAAASLKYVSHTGTDDCASNGANVNGIWEPGETVQVPVEVRASGDAFTNISGSLSTSTPGVTIVDGSATWPNLTSGASSISNAPHFTVELDPALPCGTVIDFDIALTSAQGGPFPLSFSNEVGQSVTPNNLPAAIPDNSPTGVTNTLDVATNVVLTDVDVRVEINHTWVGDLKIELESPLGTRITLLDRPGVPASGFGCADDDMNVTFDDASGFALESHCAGTSPWYTGLAAPVQALSAFNTQASAGQWKLIVADNAGQDTGAIIDWELLTTPALQGVCEACDPGVVDAPSPIAAAGFSLAQNRPNPFARATQIGFSLDREAYTSLEIYDVAGRLVRSLVDGPMEAGAHAVSWDGQDSSDRPVATGVYFYRLKTGDRSEIKRMSFLR